MTTEYITFANLDVEIDVKAAIDAYAYLGFDPVKIFEKLKGIEPNKAILVKDLQNMLVFLLTRGPNFSKHIKRTKDSKMKSDLEAIFKKYSVHDNLGTNPEADRITGGRLIATFVPMCAKLCDQDAIRDPISGSPESKALVKSYKFLQAPALIKESDSDLYDKWLAWAYKVDAVINQKAADKEKVKRYADIMRSNSPFNK